MPEAMRENIVKRIVRFRSSYALIREYLMNEFRLAGIGYVDIIRSPQGYVIRIFADRPAYIARNRAKLAQIEKEIEKRFGLKNVRITLLRPPSDVLSKPPEELTDEELVFVRELNPWIMASRIARNLERGWKFRKAAYAALRRIMAAGADGAQVVICGKITGERARCAQFVAGKIKYCGEVSERVMKNGFDIAITKAGVIGVTVRIMRPNAPLPDRIRVPSREEVMQVIEELKPKEETSAEGGAENGASEGR
ncbi:MAG: 30S ribosomal protein S3 [Thermoplasmata archaeon]|nr:MAG: 30S ribosomal protein S3 [Thermoplasmata archaeon]